MQKKWQDVKQAKKEQLAAYIKATTGDDIDTSAMFDIHVCRLCACLLRSRACNASGCCSAAVLWVLK